MSAIIMDERKSTPTDNIQSSQLTPISPASRIDSMDILRGVALIGILLMNIEWFGRAIAGLGTHDVNLTGLDHLTGWFVRCFVEGKFYKLFAVLFGMGFAVMLLRAKEVGRPFTAWFVRRMLVLFAIGLLHFVFIWPGDILHDYAFSGLLLLGWVLIVNKEKNEKYNNPRSIFKFSVIWLSVPFAFMIIGGISFGALNDNQELRESWLEEITIYNQVNARMESIKNTATDPLSTPTTDVEELDQTGLKKLETTVNTEENEKVGEAETQGEPEIETQSAVELTPEEMIEQTITEIVEARQKQLTDEAEEIAANTQSSYWDLVDYRLDILGFWLLIMPGFGFGVVFPLFLLGYWVIASGVMKNYQAHKGAFKITAWVGISIGVIMETAGLLLLQHPVAEQVATVQAVGNSIFYIGQYVMAVGYFGFFMCLMNSEKWHQRLSHFAPMGRMALTNYIMHSVILSTIFFGYAGGYYGEIARAHQMLIVVAIVLIQCLLSKAWLTKFQFGPLEWVWRSLTYKKWQPMKVTNV